MSRGWLSRGWLSCGRGGRGLTGWLGGWRTDRPGLGRSRCRRGWLGRCGGGGRGGGRGTRCGCSRGWRRLDGRRCRSRGRRSRRDDGRRFAPGRFLGFWRSIGRLRSSTPLRRSGRCDRRWRAPRCWRTCRLQRGTDRKRACDQKPWNTHYPQGKAKRAVCSRIDDSRQHPGSRYGLCWSRHGSGGVLARRGASLGVPAGLGFAGCRGAGNRFVALPAVRGIGRRRRRNLVCGRGRANLPMKSGRPKRCETGVQRRRVLDDEEQPKPRARQRSA